MLPPELGTLPPPSNDDSPLARCAAVRALPGARRFLIRTVGSTSRVMSLVGANNTGEIARPNLAGHATVVVKVDDQVLGTVHVQVDEHSETKWKCSVRNLDLCRRSVGRAATASGAGVRIGLLVMMAHQLNAREDWHSLRNSSVKYAVSLRRVVRNVDKAPGAVEGPQSSLKFLGSPWYRILSVNIRVVFVSQIAYFRTLVPN